jgi:hypothetical protein
MSRTVVEQIQTNLNGVPVASVILTTLDPGGSTPPPTLTPAPPTGTGAAASATTPNFIQGQPNQNNGVSSWHILRYPRLP